MPNVDVNAMSDEEFVEFIKGLENEDYEDEPDTGVEDVTDEGAAEEDGVTDEDVTGEGDVTDEGGAGDVGEVTDTDERNARLLSHIKGLYPDMDEGAAIDKFLDDADGEEAAAQGLSLEDYRKNKAEAAEFAEFKAEREKKKQSDEAVAAIVDGWKKDSERMKSIIPEFDFTKAMENGQFRDKVINEGKDIISAYFELNPINKPPEDNVRRDIEVGDMTGGVANGFKSPMDVRRASKEEFDRYLASIKDKE